jgi:translation initiation factor 2 alpha subunit (eIF-2alpha)
MYLIEAIKKIQIESMLMKPGKSYLCSALTQLVEEDSLTVQEINANEELCVSLINEIKKYLRLARIKISYSLNNIDNSETGQDFDYLCLPPNVILNRPGQDDDFTFNTLGRIAERQNSFSYAVGNLTPAAPSAAHAILIGSTRERLASLLKIYRSAVTGIKVQISQLVEETLDQKSGMELIQQCLDLDLNENDGVYDDLLPSKYYTLTLGNIEFYGDDQDEFQAVTDDSNDDVMQ